MEARHLAELRLIIVVLNVVPRVKLLHYAIIAQICF